MLHEQLEEQELGARELDPALSPVDLVRDRVEDEVAVAQDLALVAVAGPAEQRPESGLQLAQRERLDQVVVGADVESGDPILDRIASGEHENRGAVTRLAQAATHLQPAAQQARHRLPKRAPWPDDGVCG